MTRAARDEHGRLLPGSVPGWGISWWWREQGLDPRNASELTPEETMQTVYHYWDAVNDGWRPEVPEHEWVGPHDPFAPTTRCSLINHHRQLIRPTLAGHDRAGLVVPADHDPNLGTLNRRVPRDQPTENIISHARPRWRPVP
jgi:hypothetical protein